MLEAHSKNEIKIMFNKITRESLIPMSDGLVYVAVFYGLVFLIFNCSCMYLIGTVIWLDINVKRLSWVMFMVGWISYSLHIFQGIRHPVTQVYGRDTLTF